MESEQVARIFKALGHPTRIRIVQHLIEIDTCICGEIVGIFPYSQSTIADPAGQVSGEPRTLRHGITGSGFRRAGDRQLQADL